MSIGNQTNIKLVLKNDTWVPKKSNHTSALEQHGLDMKKVLGEGAFAKVKQAFSHKENREVAVKVFEKRRLPFDYLKRFLPREIRVLNALQHPNLVSLLDVFETTSRVYLVLEFAEGGDLLEFINQDSYKNEAHVKRHFQQLIAGMSSMHGQGIVHRDLKCENILLDARNNVKIADFGFARFTEADVLLKTICGSFVYTAPELIAGEQDYSGFLADAWSAGIILFCMLCRKLPFTKDELNLIAKGKNFLDRLEFPHAITHDARDVVYGLLEQDPLNRLNAFTVQKHKWCHGFKSDQKPYQQKGKAIDIIEAPNTIANSTRAENDRAHMLFEVVRPQGKFVRAIERQRFNLLALSVFSKNKKSAPPDARLSCVLSQSLLKSPTNARQRFNLVTSLVKCANSLASERRATTASKNRKKSQGRTILKDVEMKQKSPPGKSKMNSADSISQVGYEDFLSKKQSERGKELQNVGRSAGSNVAKRAATVKQTSYKGKPGTQAEEPNLNQESWNKKCVVACKTSRR